MLHSEKLWSMVKSSVTAIILVLLSYAPKVAPSAKEPMLIKQLAVVETESTSGGRGGKLPQGLKVKGAS